jgi:hypothetical protein
MSDALDSLFQRIDLGLKLLSPSDTEIVAVEVNKIRTKHLMEDALKDFNKREDWEAEWEAFNARRFRSDILQDLKDSNYDAAEPQVDEILKSRSVQVDKDSAIYKQLCRAALKGLAEFYSNAELIVHGDFENPRLHFEEISEPTRELKLVTHDTGELTLFTAIEKYVQDYSSSWTLKQYKDKKAKLHYFCEYLSDAHSLEAEAVSLGSINSAESPRVFRRLFSVSQAASA